MKKTQSRQSRKLMALLLTAVMMTMTVLLLTVSASAAESVKYLYPVYNVDGEPTSGIKEWKEGTVTEYTIMTESTPILESGWYVVTESFEREALQVSGDAKLILKNNTSVTIKETKNRAGIEVFGGASLTIYAQLAENTETDKIGKLTATGAKYRAGIGGGQKSNGENITINGGEIIATGGNYAAGIGGGNGVMTLTNKENGDGKNIIINGGTVTATGGNYGAGIGGGECGNCEHITINGGTVTATGGEQGAGIGSGGFKDTSIEGGGAKNITINDGDITANGGIAAAGIGGGADNYGAYITINNGTVHANGGDGNNGGSDGGAGIGGGENGEGYQITINGGKIYAKGNDEAAGIGGGEEASGHDITITDGYVEATGEGNGAGIGGGEEADGYKITITGGTVIATGGDDGGAGIGGGAGYDAFFHVYTAGDGKDITITGGSVTATGGEDGGAGIGGGRGFLNFDDGNGIGITISGGTVIATGGDDGAGIGGGENGYGKTITISNHAEVHATAGICAAGIGGGWYESGTDITITDSTVYATGGGEGVSDGGGAGIGGGYDANGSNIRIQNSYVEAVGGHGSAGIGGGCSKGGENITVSGGEIHATGGQETSVKYNGGAGIGGGYQGNGQLITIEGDAVVYAYGTDGGAGIGGGSEGAGKEITVSGKYVEGRGGSRYHDETGETTGGAGIGGGESGEGNNITIQSNATVYAYGKGGGTGIGGGSDGAGTQITISGKYVEAHGSSGTDWWDGTVGGAGIGGGNNADGSQVTISNGNVYAYGGYKASGIGGGTDGSGHDITITGGVVHAQGNNGASVGTGHGDDIDKICLGSDMVAVADDNLSDAVFGKGIDSPVQCVFFAHNKKVTIYQLKDIDIQFSIPEIHGLYLEYDECKTITTKNYSTFTEEMLKAPEGKNGYWAYAAKMEYIEQYDLYQIAEEQKINVGDYISVPDGFTVYFHEVDEREKIVITYHGPDGETWQRLYPKGTALSVEDMLAKPTYYKCSFYGWYYSEEFAYENIAKGEDAPTKDIDLYYRESMMKEQYSGSLRLTVGYLSPNYTDSTAKEIRNWITEFAECTQVTASDTEWTEGWYVASGEITIDNTVVCKGAVKLILADECRLTIRGNVQNAGIAVSDDNASLTIYAQSVDSEKRGTLHVTGDDGGAGIGGGKGTDGHSITINGGYIVATGEGGGAGIGGGKGADGYTITVSDGLVEAKGADGGAGIGGGDGGNTGAVYLHENMLAESYNNTQSTAGRGLSTPMDIAFFTDNTFIGVKNNTFLVKYLYNADSDECYRSERVTAGTAFTEEMLALPEGKTGCWRYCDTSREDTVVRVGDSINWGISKINSRNELLIYMDITEYVELRYHGLNGQLTVVDFEKGTSLTADHLRLPAYTCIGWFYEKTLERQAFEDDTISEDTDLYLKTSPEQKKYMETDSLADKGVEYLSPVYADGDNTKTVIGWETKKVIEYVEVTDSDTEWTTGWYVVKGGITVNHSIRCNGDVHLILQTGCQLLVSGKDGDAGIEVSGENNSLTIYAQSDEKTAMGLLDATGASSGGAGIGGKAGADGNNITINGGYIKATGSTGGGAGIGGGSNGKGTNIVINGGYIEACGIKRGAGIGGGKSASCDNIYIGGGEIYATGSDTSGIGSGLGGDIGNIYLASNMLAIGGDNDGKVYGEGYTTPMNTFFFSYYTDVSLANAAKNTASVFSKASVIALIAGAILFLGTVAVLVVAKRKKSVKAKTDGE